MDDPVTLVKALQTCSACPSQWDAFDDAGNYYYLRYRFGTGTVDTYSDPNPDTWTGVPEGAVARFRYGDRLDGVIELEQFCLLAGIEIAEDAVIMELGYGD